MGKKNIRIKYDIDYYNLCAGHLEVWIDEKYYDFGKYCLMSGGECCSSDDGLELYVTKGDWSISRFPNNFPMELENDLLEVINNEIPHGCCGGCL